MYRGRKVKEKEELGRGGEKKEGENEGAGAVIFRLLGKHLKQHDGLNLKIQ